MITPVTTLFVPALLLVLHLQHHETHAAHSARRNSRRIGPGSSSRYDRSISTFSDDGRLLQVEYGMEASHRGRSVSCLEITLEEGTSFVCFAVVVEEEGRTAFVGTADKVHRVDDHCLLVTTGLSGDGRALAQATRLACQRLRLTNGETATLRDVASVVAEMQHELTRTGGARPFGVTAIVVGVDPVPEGEVGECVFGEGCEGKDVVGGTRLFQSEPGGIVEEYSSCAAGKGRREVELGLVKLRKDILARRGDAMSTKDENSDERTASSSLTSPIIEEMVEGVVNVTFEANKDAKRVDVWVVTSDTKRRGKTRFRCAKSVCRDDLESVKKLF